MGETEILLYETEDGEFRLDVQTDGESVWLTQAQMADLFDKSVSTINEHVKNVFKEGELVEEGNMQRFGNSEFQQKAPYFYSLDVIISVGYRVRSQRGTQFRIWATQRLREYLIKGFTMNDERLKEAGNSRYFEELLQRIRDIRSSEKVFWRKILDIYATSIDYNPQSPLSREIFAKIQNQLHWAAHGHTAAEIIYNRADATQPDMGVTNYSGKKILKRDIEIAKNYLSEEELNILNRIVTAYLEMAEIQALNKVEMKMADWVERLKQFLTMTGRDILEDAGKISREKALAKASEEYHAYKAIQLESPSSAERHFISSMEEELRKREK